MSGVHRSARACNDFLHYGATFTGTIPHVWRLLLQGKHSPNRNGFALSAATLHQMCGMW